MGKQVTICPAFPLGDIEKAAIQLGKDRSGSPTAAGSVRYILRQWYADNAPVKHEVTLSVERELQERRY